MTKTSPSGAATTALAQEVQRLAYCLRLTRQDGTVQAFTDHDAPIPFNDGIGLLTYDPEDGMTGSAISSLFDSSVDELEISAFVDSGAITLEDLVAGRYDAAEIRVYLLNWDNPSAGGWQMRRGNLGSFEFDEGSVRVQLLGMLQKMHSSTTVELVSGGCRVRKFGDGADQYPRCKIRLGAPTWQATTAYSPARQPGSAGGAAGTEEVVVKPTTYNDRWFVLTTAGTSGGTEPSWDTTIGNTTADGTAVWTAIQAREIEATIASISNHLQFTINYAGDAPDAFLTFGYVIFNAGENINIRRPIASWDLATTTVTLALPVNLLLAVSESVTLVAGCDRTVLTCRDTYDNLKNYRGEPFLRGNDSFFRFPDAPPVE